MIAAAQKTSGERTFQPATERAEPFEISLSAVFTTSIWLSCFVIGMIGIVIPYAKPSNPPPPQPAIQAEIVNVALTAEPLTEIDDPAPPAPEILVPPPIAPPLAPPSALSYTPVAAPNPAIAFELPVAGPTRVVEAKQASYSAPATIAPTDASQPPAARLIYGRGEGAQPAPKYPPRAQAEGQEGTVRVEFTVGPDGRVLAADLNPPSPWPLLNAAALQVIREKWRFSAGPVRRWIVELEFSMRKRL